jgi:hypothetical protein
MKSVRQLVGRVWRWMRKGHDERRTVRERARFWAEVRAGEREAEAQVRH